MNSNSPHLNKTIAEVKTKALSLNKRYPRQGYLLLALGEKLKTDDYQKLSRFNVRDGKDDKKIDIYHLDNEKSELLFAQAYTSDRYDKSAPPINKAEELNTAIGWLFASDLSDIKRKDIRVAAMEARDSIRNNQIHKVEVCYIHNLPHSKDVDIALRSTRNLLKGYLKNFDIDSEFQIIVNQLSIDEVAKLRIENRLPILVQDRITLTANEVLRQSTGLWTAIVATLEGEELVKLYNKYAEKLYSPNVRDYLGESKSKRINSQIRKTASEEPYNFYVFNNGISFITNKIHAIKNDKIELDGIGIINGAQTTGSLVRAFNDKGKLENVKFMARIIECKRKNLVEQIIKYNNTQNPIKPWELRTNDPIQETLRKRFEKIGFLYDTRRGQSPRKKSSILFDKLGPMLLAFYRNAFAAYKNPNDIYDSTSTYNFLYNNDSRADNMATIYFLGRAISDYRAMIRKKVKEKAAKPNEIILDNWFVYNGTLFAVLFSIGDFLCELLDVSGESGKKLISLKMNVLKDDNKRRAILDKVVRAVGSILPSVVEDTSSIEHFKNNAAIEDTARKLRSWMTAMKELSQSSFKEMETSFNLSK